MKVLLLHNYHGSSAPSGENEAVNSDASLLRAYGHEVEILDWRMDALPNSRAAQFSAAVLCAWNPAAYARVKRAVLAYKPHVVHIHNTFPQVSAAVFYAARHWPQAAVVFSAHNYRSICASGLMLRDGKPCRACIDAGSSLPAIRYRCYRGNRLATVAASVSVDLHRWTGTFREMPDAIIVFTKVQRDILAASGFPSGRFYIRPHHYADPLPRVPWSERSGSLLYVGRLSHEKGADVLLKALALLPDVPACDIIGDGYEAPQLRAKAAALGIAERVRFHGMVSHEAAQCAIRNSRIVVIPSICNEGFPMVYREAMAFGTPVLASRIGALGEIVREGENGSFFEAGNPAGLAAQLNRMLADGKLLERMSENAYARYMSEYSGPAGYESLMRIYSAAQQNRSRRHATQMTQRARGEELAPCK